MKIENNLTEKYLAFLLHYKSCQNDKKPKSFKVLRDIHNIDACTYQALKNLGYINYKNKKIIFNVNPDNSIANNVILTLRKLKRHYRIGKNQSPFY